MISMHVLEKIDHHKSFIYIFIMIKKIMSDQKVDYIDSKKHVQGTVIEFNSKSKTRLNIYENKYTKKTEYVTKGIHFSNELTYYT